MSVKSKLTALADAIRENRQINNKMTIEQMVSFIPGIRPTEAIATPGIVERSLKSYVVPNSVTSIRDRAFSGCTSLTSVTIPKSVLYISPYAFSGCDSLTDIYCGFAENAVSGAPWGAPDTTTIHYNYNA